MPEKHSVIFYPVGNGDTSQVILHQGKRVLLDFCHRPGSEDASIPCIDLKKRLREELKEAKRDYFDVVAFTHADLDHIQGSTDFFHLEHAAKYQGADRVKINELWVPAAMVMQSGTNEQQSDEYIILRQEARHRLLEGKGVLVFSKPQGVADWLEPELKKRGEAPDARDHLFVDAGQLVPGFSLLEDGAEFFCHSPFIKHCEEGDIVRNLAALVFNIRMQVGVSTFDYLEVGDADWEALEDIVNTTKFHGNEDRLRWNILNIPHHCSYLALSDDKGITETVPKPGVEELLLMGQPDSYVVSCSKPVPNLPAEYKNVQPPHIQARNTYENYVKKVRGRRFLVTMEEPNAFKPEPIIFEVTSGGISWSKSAIVGAPAIITSRPSRAG